MSLKSMHKVEMLVQMHGVGQVYGNRKVNEKAIYTRIQSHLEKCLSTNLTVKADAHPKFCKPDLYHFQLSNVLERNWISWRRNELWKE